MEIKYFKNGFVGKAVFDTNEAIKCFNAGMDVVSEIGDFLYENMEGNLPDDSEVISRIIEIIQENGKVYVGFYLKGKKVVDIDSTNLSCGIKDGQTVYFLHSGEIVSGEVVCISLATNREIEERGRFRFDDAVRYGRSHDYERNGSFESAMGVIYSILTKDCVCINVKKLNKSLYVPLDKVFSTKEALVQDLLSKSK